MVEPPKVAAVTAEDFLKRQYPPKKPLVEGLVHSRDMIGFGARRRHGKTRFLTNLAVALAEPAPQFIGYQIPQRRRSLLLMLEDDPGEYQSTLKAIVGERDVGGCIKVMTRVDFYANDVPLDVRHPTFQNVVRFNAGLHSPDLIVLDNLAQVISADYNDSTRIHDLMKFCFNLTADFDCAVAIAAHPRKQGDRAVALEDDPDGFFESIMGSSHFINSTGSLWGMERSHVMGHSTFLGGRQRSEGSHGISKIRLDEQGWFELMDDAAANILTVLNTNPRRKAWQLLPDPPATFGYREGEAMVKPAMSSSGSYAAWMKECRRLKVIVDAGEKLTKAEGLARNGLAAA